MTPQSTAGSVLDSHMNPVECAASVDVAHPPGVCIGDDEAAPARLGGQGSVVSAVEQTPIGLASISHGGAQ
jgi:hypothetical protein